MRAMVFCRYPVRASWKAILTSAILALRLQVGTAETRAQVLVIGAASAAATAAVSSDSLTQQAERVREEWLRLGTYVGDPGVLFLDTASVRQQGAYREAWLKAVYPSHAQRDPVSTRWLAVVTYREQIDCAGTRSRTAEVRFRYEDGTEFDFPAAHMLLHWEMDGDPTSAGAKVAEIVCGVALESATDR